MPAAASVDDYMDCGDPTTVVGTTEFAATPISGTPTFNGCCNKNADCKNGSKCVAAYQAGTWVRRICVPCLAGNSGPYSIPEGTVKETVGGT